MSSQGESTPKSRSMFGRHWLTLLLLVAAFAAVGFLVWPHISFLTDRDAVRELIVEAGPWAPLVYVGLQITQTVFAPIPGTVISIVGGYIYGTMLSTLYAMIGTTLGFLVIFTLSKRYGRRIMKYFVSDESVDKYDKLSTSKSGYVFIALGFLFPFIPDPVLGYIAGTTPISTRVLMIICTVMRLPGVMMSSFVGSQVGEGNFGVVAIFIVLLIIVLVLSAVFYKQISAQADRLYAMAARDNKRAHLERVEDRKAVELQKKQLRRRRKALTKKFRKTLRRPARTRRRKTKHR